MGVILPMNFILLQDSKENFIKYLLHKGVVSFNKVEDHCLQLTVLLSSSQDTMKKGNHIVLCSWDPHPLFTPTYPQLSLPPVLENPIQYQCTEFVTPSDFTIPWSPSQSQRFTPKAWPLFLLSFTFPEAKLLQGPAAQLGKGPQVRNGIGKTHLLVFPMLFHHIIKKIPDYQVVFGTRFQNSFMAQSRPQYRTVS